MGTILSGRVHLAGAQHIDPRFYATLVDLKGAGKGGSYTETLGCFADLLGDLHIKNSVDSGPALVKALAFTPRMLLYCDELASGLFEKAKVTGGSRNSLFGDLLTLHDGHAVANDTKGNLDLPGKVRKIICDEGGAIEVKNAHFSMIGCVQPQTFADMWRGTKAAASGLQDRFLLVSSGQEFVPEPQRESDRAAVDQAIECIRKQISRYLPGQSDDEHISFTAEPLIRYPEELGARQREWWESRYTALGASSRMPALVMRMALMLAITNDAEEVTPDLLGQAIAFAEYQISLRERLLPPDAMSNVQAFEELIQRRFAKFGSQGLTFNQVRRYTNPEQHKLLGGYGPFMKAWQNLILAGVVRAASKNRKAAIYVYES